MYISVGDLLIYSAGILWGIELIPQIRKTIQTKNVSGISLSFYLICYLAYIIATIGNALKGQWSVVISFVPSFILLAWMIVLLFKYRKN